MTTPQERAELAPCPFCGGRPERIKKGLDERFAYADEVTYMCKTCGCSRSARGDTSKPGYADNSTVEQRALAAWNTRHQAAALIEADAGEAVEWKDGVNVARLRAALTRMGVATEPSEEGMAADLENWVNTLTRAVTAGKPAAQVAPGAVPDGWQSKFEELLEDYAGARAETAVFNATQRSGMTVRMAHPRLKRLMDHVAALSAAPKPQEPV